LETCARSEGYVDALRRSERLNPGVAYQKPKRARDEDEEEEDNEAPKRLCVWDIEELRFRGLGDE